jgi:CspA family cold shock protein
MQTGLVKFYNVDKGFGFIEADGQDVFFHITQVVEGYEPQDGDTVQFEISNGRDGRPAAANVSPASAEGHEEEVYDDAGDEE